MTSPFDIIRHINEKSELDFDIKDYSPFLINRTFSNLKETIFFAEIMNQMFHLPLKAQYEFYLYALPKGKRFGKWHKQEDINMYVEMIMDKYLVNRQMAEVYYKLLNETQLKELKNSRNEGGK